jgi:histidyl-tRNA synthetase
MADKSKKISKESYKGVRDFYPDSMYIQNYIFDTMSRVAESFGYSEYGASVLEQSELYEAKSGEEIVNEQTYTFTDRGDRSVTLRPEMTPTIARMIAAKKRDLVFPLRWYSIPNLFRYERPQKGRLREHWQLNVDLFGTNNIESDVEVIEIAHAVMINFGAKEEQFKISINSREFMEHVFDFYSLSEEERHSLSKLIDRKNKIEDKDFKRDLHEILSEKENLAETFYKFIGKNNFGALPKNCLDSDQKRKLDEIVKMLEERGLGNVLLDVTVMRGFDYYTGVVFEIFDTGEENKRSLFGGGRYDDLLNIFGMDSLPAVGFGMGDVTIRDFLNTYKLLPDPTSSTDLYICVLDEKGFNLAHEMAKKLREQEINVAIDYTNKKAGDQIKVASKIFIPFTLCLGENEINGSPIQLKNLKTGKETECRNINDVALHIKG